jgi:hypothetical protein
VIDALDGGGVDMFSDFDSTDVVLLVGLSLSSGIGSQTVVLSDGTQLVASGVYDWQVDDFVLA